MKIKKILSAAALGLIALGSIGMCAALAQASTIPIVTDYYSDSLQAGVNASATSFSLVKGYDGQLKNLSGAYGFTLDQGTASQENVFCTTVSGTSASGCVRGLDLTSGTTSVSSLEFSHYRGASVQITTAPIINILTNIFRGVDFIPQPINYDPSISTTTIAANRNSVASVGLLDDTAFNGASVISATTGARGVVQVAIGSQAAASTQIGSTLAPLALTTTIATSTFNSQTAANVIPVTNTLGHIDAGFVSSSTSFSVSASSTLMASTSIGNFMALNIGKNMFISTSTGTSTWSVPAGISRALIELCGAGGGGTVNAGGSSNEVGGGAGATAIGIINFPATSTIQFFIGTGGIGVSGSGGTTGGWTTFGTNGFYMSAQGGNGGNGAAGVSPATANGPIALAGFVPSIQSMSGTNFGAGNFFFAKGAPSQLGGYSSCYGGDNNSSGATSGTSGGNGFIEGIY